MTEFHSTSTSEKECRTSSQERRPGLYDKWKWYAVLPKNNHEERMKEAQEICKKKSAKLNINNEKKVRVLGMGFARFYSPSS